MDTVQHLACALPLELHLDPRPEQHLARRTLHLAHTFLRENAHGWDGCQVTSDAVHLVCLQTLARRRVQLAEELFVVGTERVDSRHVRLVAHYHEGLVCKERSNAVEQTRLLLNAVPALL
eukprot:7980236-Pyramimonas_sp.AAC.1